MYLYILFNSSSFLQFSGATLCKGLNRGFGTLCAASLAFFIEIVAQKSGKEFHAIFIGISVFLVGKKISTRATHFLVELPFRLVLANDYFYISVSDLM